MLIRCAFDWQSGGCAGGRFRVLLVACSSRDSCWSGYAAERARRRAVCARCMSFVITLPPLVTLLFYRRPASVVFYIYIPRRHEMALEPIARALQIILQPPSGNQRISALAAATLWGLEKPIFQYFDLLAVIWVLNIDEPAPDGACKFLVCRVAQDMWKLYTWLLLRNTDLMQNYFQRGSFW